MQQELEALVDAWSAPLLRWALRQTGAQTDAEDLVQEVWEQFFLATERERKWSRPVEAPERLLWKVARYVRCHRLRRTMRERQLLSPLDEALPDTSDFAARLVEESEQAELIASMRRCVMRQGALQRSILLMYYLEQKPVREIARQLHISEPTVKWHLFDTRRKLKEDIGMMQNTTQPQDFVYQPTMLHMACAGKPSEHPDTQEINGSLVRQNICLACYHGAQTIRSLVEKLGIPAPYIEFDVNWLVQHEFLTKEKGRYLTAFQIESDADQQAKYAVYLKHRAGLSDTMLRMLTEREADIRAIGFIGCDKPLNELLWLLIHHTAQYIWLPIPDVEAPLRPDGGKYFPLGFTNAAASCDTVLDTEGWGYNGPMESGGFAWFGTHCFSRSGIVEMMSRRTVADNQLHHVLTALLHNGGSTEALPEDDRITLARLVEEGYLRMEDDKAKPTFCVFTRAQHEQLVREIIEPIAWAVKRSMHDMADDMDFYTAQVLPQHLRHLAPLTKKMALSDLGFVTTVLAYQDGLLKKPAEDSTSAFLTLLYTDD